MSEDFGSEMQPGSFRADGGESGARSVDDTARPEDWEKVTVRMPESMVKRLDDVAEHGAAANRSQAIRAAVDAADLEGMFR